MNGRTAGTLREQWEEGQLEAACSLVPVGQAVTSPVQFACITSLLRVSRASRNRPGCGKKGYFRRECSKWVWGFEGSRCPSPGAKRTEALGSVGCMVCLAAYILSLIDRQGKSSYN